MHIEEHVLQRMVSQQLPMIYDVVDDGEAEVLAGLTFLPAPGPTLIEVRFWRGLSSQLRLELVSATKFDLVVVAVTKFGSGMVL